MVTPYQVIIIGAGMVGAGVAIALSRAGVSVALVEQSSLIPKSMAGDSGFEPRVSAINKASRHWLNHLKLWPELEPFAQPIERMNIWEQDGTGHVEFDALSQHQPDLGCIIENRRIQEALANAVAQESIRVYSPCSIDTLNIAASDHTDTNVEITLSDGTQLSTELLIGADGSNSKVRSLAGMDQRTWDYQHKAIVTTVATELPHQQTAFQIFRNDGPLAFLPLPTSRTSNASYSSIVWSCKTEAADRLTALSDQEFAHQLGFAIEHRLGKIISVDKRYSFPLGQSHARQYIKPGIALIGDAAHRIHPLAGQGVNLGFMDAAALTEVLLKAQAADCSFSHEFYLRQYQRLRQTHNLSMTAGMEGFKRLFETSNLPVRWLRNVGMDLFNQQRWLKQEVGKLAAGEIGPPLKFASAPVVSD